MNRKHIYRGKRLDNGAFVEGDLFYHNGAPCIMLSTDDNYGFDWVEVHPDTVGEFTGLTDRNGKDIYEGDIVNIDGKYTRYVVYSGEHTAFCAMRYISAQSLNLPSQTSCESRQWKFTTQVGGSYAAAVEYVKQLYEKKIESNTARIASLQKENETLAALLKDLPTVGGDV